MQLIYFKAYFTENFCWWIKLNSLFCMEIEFLYGKSQSNNSVN